MNYKKIKPKKLYEEVAEAIYELIRTGELKPGEKLDSVQLLAENFQVGRSAIREALTSLRAMGLVELRQGEGTYVREFDTDQITFPLSTAILMNKKDIIHLLEVRKIIEIGSVIAASRKRTEQQLKVLWDALIEMKSASGNEELGEEADLKFHLALAEAAQNPLLFSLLNHVSGLMKETMKETRRVWLFSKQTTMEQLYQEHLNIYQAVRDMNDEKASHYMLVHLQNVETILQKYFQQTTVIE
jgi:GntR family transcriptional regulator, transcriptional repressor for pyruvate dehydrogenase complex